MNQFKRFPAKEKLISEIDQNDVRVRIIGTVISINDNSIVLDDGENTVEIMFDDTNNLGKLNIGDFIRVVARVLPSIDGFELKGECIQDLKGFNVKFYKEAKKLYESYIG